MRTLVIASEAEGDRLKDVIQQLVEVASGVALQFQTALDNNIMVSVCISLNVRTCSVFRASKCRKDVSRCADYRCEAVNFGFNFGKSIHCEVS